MHNVTEIKMLPTTEDVCLARGQEQSSMPAIAQTWRSDWVPHNKVVFPPLSKACLVSGNLTQSRGKTKAPLWHIWMHTYGCMIRAFPHHLSGLCFPSLGEAVPHLLQLRGQKTRCSGFFLTHCILKIFQSWVHYLEVGLSQLPCLRWEGSSSCCAYYECWIWTTHYVLEYPLLPLHQVACENTVAHKELWISSSWFRVKPKGRIPTALVLRYKIR